MTKGLVHDVQNEILRAGFEPATYGCPHHYSPPLYQLIYRRCTVARNHHTPAVLCTHECSGNELFCACCFGEIPKN
jgi:hypothetical protein